MNKVLLILLVLAIGLSSCTKGFDELAQAKEQAKVDDKIITDYIANTPGLSAVAKRIDTTGVYYVVLAPGSGNDLFTNSTSITVDYVGKKLVTGEEFTKSNNFHPSFLLGSVIKGWQLGIPQINKGGKVRLLIPSRYAYGPYDQPDIGLEKNSILDFEIQLLDVTN